MTRQRRRGEAAVDLNYETFHHQQASLRLSLQDATSSMSIAGCAGQQDKASYQCPRCLGVAQDMEASARHARMARGANRVQQEVVNGLMHFVRQGVATATDMSFVSPYFDVRQG